MLNVRKAFDYLEEEKKVCLCITYVKILLYNVIHYPVVSLLNSTSITLYCLTSPGSQFHFHLFAVYV